MRNTQLRTVKPETDESGRVPLTRILVVDDDPRLLRIVSKILTDEGHEVETVDNGRDALERIKSRRYSLILTGIRMPYMNGCMFRRKVGQGSGLNWATLPEQSGPSLKPVTK